MMPAPGSQKPMPSVAAGELTASLIVDWPEAERTIHALVRAEGHTAEPVTSFITLLRDHYRHEA